MPAGRSRGVLAALLLFASAASCARERKNEALPPPPDLAAKGRVIGTVGGTPILAETVVGIARARHVSIAEARDLAVRDALFANEAIARRLDVGAQRDLDAALARALAAGFADEARAKGPITAEEVDKETVNHFYDVARPESWLTIHAVVLLGKDASDDDVKRAKKVADAIHAAVAGIAAGGHGTHAPPTSDALAGDFANAAAAVDKDGFDVHIEPLPPIAADGGSVEPTQRQPFDKDFVKVATALGERGDLSDVVRTQFGWHVILLLDRIPARELSFDERKALFDEYIIDARARTASNALLERLRAGNAPDLARNLDAVLATVHIGDETGQAARVEP
jgi:hypothetical protein